METWRSKWRCIHLEGNCIYFCWKTKCTEKLCSLSFPEPQTFSRSLRSNLLLCCWLWSQSLIVAIICATQHFTCASCSIPHFFSSWVNFIFFKGISFISYKLIKIVLYNKSLVYKSTEQWNDLLLWCALTTRRKMLNAVVSEL